MTKVIRLTESQLIKLIKNVISEQARGGTDPEVLQAIADMNFTKDACRKEKISAPELVHEYCNTTYPNIIISYTLDGLELLDRKNMKIINSRILILTILRVKIKRMIIIKVNN